MSTNIDIQSRLGFLISVTALVFIVLFAATSCSAFISTQKTDDQQASVTRVDAIASKVIKPVQEASKSPGFDKSMDDWQKARAVYLRSLDYARIDQQNNGHEEYLLKSNLVESRYHIKTSESAMYVEHDFPKALQELRLAEQRFIQAIKKANPEELIALRQTKPALDELLQQAKLSSAHDCIYPQFSSYQVTEEKIEELLATR